MTPIFSRRRVLMAGAATGALGLLPNTPAFAGPTRQLRATTRVIEVNGKSASMFAITGADGRDGASLAPGERFAVTLENTCGAPTIIHWHGQTPPVAQDGVTATGYEQPIASGAAASYDYIPRPGTHWMHSHLGLQEQQLMAAPLIVHTPDDLRADTQEVTLLLHDFTFKDPAEILAGLTGGTASGGMSMMGNGSTMRGMGPDLNDVVFDAYLANGHTLDDPQVTRVERGGRVRLRLINGATATAFWIDTGGVPAQVIAVDGDAVQPLDISAPLPIAQGQRLDLLLILPPGEGTYPILAQREGDVARTGLILATPSAKIFKFANQAATPAGACDTTLEANLRAQTPLAERPIDRVYQVLLAGSMAKYDWTINGQTWQTHAPLLVKQGERVALDIFNHSMMSHPMHLHGHHFQVIAINGTAFAGAMRDTVLVPPKSSMRIAFDAANPGRWLFHCHNLYHMAAGMMTEVRYA
ncbi:multicopper oxidase family protein [Acidocella aromatica]|uniref:FtsP/CotA-like multicopper oxidase with cupredoxin domain n=1 Tax=Acidocella aromatica TaxID=1303579 RepID=A0A840VMM8_9PROT|nr:multicopper oxidase family protein [Acidocella aromatica]MBB5373439.1 FtsP/CotA-like multicopper oxidase with cupredoxin domain [Acidocella aromatica]